MTQQDFKYLAYCKAEDNNEYVFKANAIEGLQDKIDDWYEETKGYTPYESHVIDNTICISNFQFLIYNLTQEEVWTK